MAQRLSRETVEWVKQYYMEKAYGGHSVEQDRHNHIDCPAGQDTRQRLYTRVTEDNSKILMHCFNCGGSGVIPLRPTVEQFFAKDSRVRTPDYEEWDKAVEEYSVASPLQYKWWESGLEHTRWPYQWIFNEDEYVAMANEDWFGIRASHCNYITPLGSTGFEFRTLDKNIRRVMHPLHKNDSKVLVYNRTNSDTAIVCEDALSAMKCDLAGYGGVALCGSLLNTDDAFKLSMRFKRFLVWLDNDNPEVIANAKVAKDRLSLYCDKVRINLEDRDPKRYSLPSIKFDVGSRFKEE